MLSPSKQIILGTKKEIDFIVGENGEIPPPQLYFHHGTFSFCLLVETLPVSSSSIAFEGELIQSQ